MSDFGQPQPCCNSCGASIYFDRNSTVGHPSENKWMPLEYVNGIKTDRPHNCPNRKESKTRSTTSAAQSTLTEVPNMEGEIIQLMSLLISKMQILIE